jgi:hypothetical protein
MDPEFELIAYSLGKTGPPEICVSAGAISIAG